MYTFMIEDDTTVPAYIRITNALKKAIESGDLPAGECLPSTRTLSRMLGMSRPTICKALEALIAQGYIKTMKGRSSIIAKRFEEQKEEDIEVEYHSINVQALLSDYARQVKAEQCKLLADIACMDSDDAIAPPVESLPAASWIRAVRTADTTAQYQQKCARENDTASESLRLALSAYLRRSRDMRLRSDSIVLFPNNQAAIAAMLSLFVTEGTRVAIERTSSPRFRFLLNAAGADAIVLPADEDGPRPDLLSDCDRPAVMYLQPSHNISSGAVMSPERRKALVEWADRKNVLIIEDDCDHHIHYGQPPVPSMYSLTSPDNVIYFTDFNRLIYPLSTVCAVAAGPVLAPMLKLLSSSLHGALIHSQLVGLQNLLDLGQLERHGKRLRSLYAKRLQSGIRALTICFKRSARIARQAGLTHLQVRLLSTLPDEAIEQIIDEIGLKLISTQAYYASPEMRKKGEFVLFFSRHTAVEIEEKIAQLHQRMSELEGETQDFSPHTVSTQNTHLVAGGTSSEIRFPVDTTRHSPL